MSNIANSISSFIYFNSYSICTKLLFLYEIFSLGNYICINLVYQETCSLY